MCWHWAGLQRIGTLASGTSHVLPGHPPPWSTQRGQGGQLAQPSTLWTILRRPAQTLALITAGLGGVGAQVRAASRLLPFLQPLFSLVSSPHLAALIEENKELMRHPSSRAAVWEGLESCLQCLGLSAMVSPSLPLPFFQCPSPRRPTAPPSPRCP